MHDTAKITVKNESPGIAKVYNIPRELLRWHSAYFAAALDPESDFSRDQDGGLTLAVDAGVFDAFHCWLYTGKLKDPPESAQSTDLLDVYLPEPTLYMIWMFADMRGISGLGNTAIDMLHESMAAEWSISSQFIRMVYKKTASGCNLRQFVLDCQIKTQSFTSLHEQTIEYNVPNGFLLEALPTLVRNGIGSASIGLASWTKLDRCKWHDHSGPGGRLRLEMRK